MTEATIDRKTATFYLSLAVLVVIDLILLVWIFSASARLETQAYASEKPKVVSEETKPSPFEVRLRRGTASLRH